MGGGGIIVGSLTPNDQSPSSSNKAGDLRQHYISALYTSPVSSVTGNSFASARVAAGAALLKTRDGHLSNAQIVQILLQSADDIGARGVDPIFGHGRKFCVLSFSCTERTVVYQLIARKHRQ
ncbi:S8 family serine peptidase [Pseudomonadota bacterium]